MQSRFGFSHRGPAHRPPYQPGIGDHRRDGWDGGHRGGWDHDHDHWRRGWFGGTYAYGYPGWPVYGYPYPYVIDPGFYDWGNTGDYGNDQAAAANSYPPNSDYGDPQQPEQPYDAPPPYSQPASPQQYQPEPSPGAARPAYSGSSSSSSAPEQRLTLIFKDGRAPQTMQNYMMNSKQLTCMDPQHFEQIPLDQIDIAATVKANRANGLDFVVPGAVRD